MSSCCILWTFLLSKIFRMASNETSNFLFSWEIAVSAIDRCRRFTPLYNVLFYIVFVSSFPFLSVVLLHNRDLINREL